MAAKHSGQSEVRELTVIPLFRHEIYFVLDQKTSTSSSGGCKKSIHADNDNKIVIDPCSGKKNTPPSASFCEITL